MSEQSLNQPHWVVGVDVGGTFTDLFVLDEKTGQARIVKVPSTNRSDVAFLHVLIRRSDAKADDTYL